LGRDGEIPLQEPFELEKANSWDIVDGHFDPPETPSTVSDSNEPLAPEVQSREDPIEEDTDDDDLVRERGELVPQRKPGGYDSRVEQLLYENPNLPILIVEAGKSIEGGGRYIVYTIQTQDLQVRRRYSEFDSLREALVRLHPTLIIPPIPDKHSIADYATNPTNAKNDQHTIDQRKRMLAVFLNRCRRMDQIRTDGVWWRFLDPNSSWVGASKVRGIARGWLTRHRMRSYTLTPSPPFPDLSSRRLL
jgi:sorting nexin-41/42